MKSAEEIHAPQVAEAIWAEHLCANVADSSPVVNIPDTIGSRSGSGGIESNARNLME